VLRRECSTQGDDTTTMLTCCLPSQKEAEFLEEHRPGRLLLEHQMVRARE
jgi:hypothetical protein